MDNDLTGTRGRILRSAYGLFYKEGFARVSVDAIAARAKVTKKTVYYHFKSKDEIVADVLDNQHQYLMQQFQDWAGSPSARPVEMIENLFMQLKNWADGANWLGSGFTRITTELADMPGHPARRAASSHKAKVEQWLEGQLAAGGLKEPDQLSRQIMILIEGSMSLSLIHGDTGYIRSSAIAAMQLLTASEQQHHVGN